MMLYEPDERWLNFDCTLGSVVQRQRLFQWPQRWLGIQASQPWALSTRVQDTGASIPYLLQQYNAYQHAVSSYYE